LTRRQSPAQGPSPEDGGTADTEPMRRLNLLTLLIVAVAVELWVFLKWMWWDLNENCGGPGREPCSWLWRDHGDTVLAVTTPLTLVVIVTVCRLWRRD
jgi:hypothetical protein